MHGTGTRREIHVSVFFAHRESGFKCPNTTSQTKLIFMDDVCFEFVY